MTTMFLLISFEVGAKCTSNPKGKTQRTGALKWNLSYNFLATGNKLSLTLLV